MPKNTNMDTSSTTSTPSAQQRRGKDLGEAGSGSAHPADVLDPMAQHMSAIQRIAPTLSMIPSETALAFPPMINEDGTLPTAEQILRHQEAFHERVRAEIQQTHERMVQEVQEMQAVAQQPRNTGLLTNSNDGDSHFYSSETLIRSDGDGNVVRRTIVNRDGEVEERVDTVGDGQRLLKQ